MDAGFEIVELTDNDFERMLDGSPAIREGIAAPPGGVDAPDVVAHVRALTRALHAGGRRTSWMMVAGGEAVGMIGTHHAPDAAGVVEIGYGVAESRRRRGYATAAVREVIRLCERDPEIACLVAETGTGNEPSARALSANGFTSTGRRISAEDGEVECWRLWLAPFAAIDHVQLAMPAGEEAAARAFYAGVLGLEEIPKPPELAARGGAWFRSGPVQIHLGVESEFRAARKAHPALRCSAYAKLVKYLQTRDVTVVDDGTLFLGDAHCYIDDPFGNRIELIAT